MFSRAVERTILSLSFATILLAALATACSSSKPLSRDDFGQALCRRLSQCCATAGFTIDASQCVFSETTNGDVFDPDAAQRCLNAYDADLTGACSHGVSGACDGVYRRPNLRPGDSCGYDGLCEPDSWCVGPYGASVCVRVHEGTDGDGPCVGSVDAAGWRSSFGATTVKADGVVCAAGFYCDGTCHALPKAGQPCAPIGCADGFGCSPLPTPHCEAYAAEGEPCDYTLPCTSPTSGRSRVGYACGPGLDCGPSRTCQKLPKLGASCGACCGDGNYCSHSSTCEQPLPTGATCLCYGEQEADCPQCASGVCVDGTCKAIRQSLAYLCSAWVRGPG